MIGSKEPKAMAVFYEKVFAKKADMVDGDWYGWQVGASFFGVGPRDDVSKRSPEPGRVMWNFETTDVASEYARIKDLGAVVIKEPYEMQPNFWIATFADPDGNYFQLMSPWQS